MDATQNQNVCQRCKKSFSLDFDLYIHQTFAHESKILDWLFIGNGTNALDENVYDHNGISYLLNCACDCDDGEIVKKKNLVYKKVNLEDWNEFLIEPYFAECFDFIDQAKANNQKILVHCQAGASRSAAIVIGYLMKTLEMSYEEAFTFTKKKREIVYPNEGFQKELMSLGEKLALNTIEK